MYFHLKHVLVTLVLVGIKAHFRFLPDSPINVLPFETCNQYVIGSSVHKQLGKGLSIGLTFGLTFSA
jgi:hypothetical protein